MIQALIGPLANLAGTWLQGKVDTKAAETKMKVTQAEAKSQILMSQAQSEANWEKIMAEGSKHSFKDEYILGLMPIPMILCFCGPRGQAIVFDDQRRSRVAGALFVQVPRGELASTCEHIRFYIGIDLG